MSVRRLFIATGLSMTALIAVLIVTSQLAVGGPEFEDNLHGIAEIVAGLFAGAVALVAATRSLGRHRVAWCFWSAYAFLAALGEGISLWNALVTHTTLNFPSAADAAFLLQVPAGVAAALILLRTNSSWLAVCITLLDGLLVGAGVLLIGIATILDSFLESNTNSLGATLVSLAEPATDLLVLTLMATVVLRIAPMARPSPMLIAAGIAGIALSDSATTYQILGGLNVPGSSYAIGWTAGFVGVGLGALYAVCFRGRADIHVRPPATGLLGSLAPVVSVAVASVLAGYRFTADADTATLVIWAMVGLMTLTLVRMGLALYMNARLGQTLAHQASHDSLTRLPNRALLQRRLTRAVDTESARSNSVVLLLLDLDGFKGVNDTYGHVAGDELLIQVAARLATCTRDGDLLGRLGGDEFALVLNAKLVDAIAFARRILTAFESSFVVGATPVSVGASVGIAIGERGTSAVDLLRNADLAMYSVKASGGNGYALYEPQMHEAVAERTRLETALQTVWLGDDLVAHYQPIVDLASGRMVGVEALARWRQPDGAMVMPDVFIPLAEQTGAIVPIGARILRDACSRLAVWQRQHFEAADLTVSVNVSPRQLRSGDLVETVSEALRSSGIRPGCLTLEVTETAVMDNLAGAIKLLEALKGLGIRLAIDDFGIGASSLARLRRLPVDVVKIDKSLVDNVPDGRLACSLLAAVVGVVKALHLQIVIEGVERADQAAHLRDAGYDLAQGYYFSRPVDAAGIDAYVAASRIGRSALAGVASPAPRVEAETRRILVVDDNADIGEAACRVLERQGMTAVLASTVVDARKELDSGVDALIVDIGLPDGDGWSLVASVRSSRAHARIPVVVMTGLLDSADVLNRTYEFQCEYLGKPFAPEALVAKLVSANRLVAT